MSTTSVEGAVRLAYSTEASRFQRIRKASEVPLPKILRDPHAIGFASHEALGAVADHEDIQAAFPATYGLPRVSLEATSTASARHAVRVGVVLSGGQAPGGHNVISGIYDHIKSISTDSVLIGFLDGPQGIYNNKYCVIDDPMMDNYRNSGGFDMIGSGRHKIEKLPQFVASMENCIRLQLDGLVVIGGDDSNTNAALLAEYFQANGCRTKVCGCPKTIDGDLKVDPYIPISFGFDTACRTYAELVGNLGQDTLSSQKYYHFVRLMGRAASNIALECALATRPNICLISEEVEARRLTLEEITRSVVDVVVARANVGKNYGIVLLPEGLIEFIPEFNSLISDINDVLATGVEPSEDVVSPLLKFQNQAVFGYLPNMIKQQLLLDRDPHGNVQVAKIETERLLAQTVAMELHRQKENGGYVGDFTPQFHSFGYEGRSCLPSAFDSTYCYALGQNVAALVCLGFNGLISSVTNLQAPVEDWKCGGVPITMMCHMEKRHGHMKPVIKKALVELDGEPFKCFAAQRDDWARFDLYRSPGPIQFFDDNKSVELCITLALELLKSDPRMDTADLEGAKALQSHSTKFGEFVHAPLNSSASLALSEAQKRRLQFVPTVASVFRSSRTCHRGQATQCRKAADREHIHELFPHLYGAPLVSIDNVPGDSAQVSSLRVGVVFCGRQAPGGHDVISGLFDSLGENSTLIGFVGGTVGLAAGHHVVLNKETLAWYRGQGGYDLLCRSADSIHKPSYHDILNHCSELTLDGLVLIGGGRTCTQAVYLAEFLASHNSKTCVVVAPVDISGSLRNEFVETTVGFDTATKVASQVVGNNATDGASAKKYYYFMRLMGDQPSHAALEVALSAKPNYVLLAEEVLHQNMSLAEVVRSIADVVQARAKDGKNYGTVLIPEGLVETIPELKHLISEIDAAYKLTAKKKLDAATVKSHMTIWSRAVLDSFPEFIQVALLQSRSSNDTIATSQAETEKLLAHLVGDELAYRKSQGKYNGSFSVVTSFIGYQARGALPSNFDINYAYNLGYCATALIEAKLSGYVACLNHLKEPTADWVAGGVPIVSLLAADMHHHKHARHGAHALPSVPKAHVDVHGPAFDAYVQMKRDCALKDSYENPGPLQFSGPCELVNSIPNSLTLETFRYLTDVRVLQDQLRQIEEACRPGCSQTTLHVAIKNLTALTGVLELVQEAENQRKSLST